MTRALPRFCEVIGLPGAGKTTFIDTATSGLWRGSFHDLEEALYVAICRVLSENPASALADKRFPSADRLELRKSFIGRHFRRSNTQFNCLVDFVAQNGAYTRYVLDALEVGSNEAERRLALSWLFTLFTKYQCTSSTENDGQIVLIDEGFVGRVITLFAYRPVQSSLGEGQIEGGGHSKTLTGHQPAQPPSSEIGSYVRLVPKPHAVVRLKLAIDECLSRLTTRPQGPPVRFRSLAIEERLMILRNCQRCLDAAQAELSAIGVPVIEIDSALDPQEQVDAAAIALHLSRPSH